MGDQLRAARNLDQVKMGAEVSVASSLSPGIHGNPDASNMVRVNGVTTAGTATTPARQFLQTRVVTTSESTRRCPISTGVYFLR